jgi:endonuclease/exonuclease/phosphatase (EEP) superfamily protein YafD
VSTSDAHKINSPEADTTKPKRKSLRIWHGATTAIVIGIAGLTAGRLGLLWVGFDVFSQFSLQFIFLSLAAMIGMVAPRYKALVAAIFFTGFVAAYSAWPHMVSATPAPLGVLKPTERQLKVASFNTLVTNQNHAALIATIKAMNADVIALVEFDYYKSAVLTALKSEYPYGYDCVTLNNCEMAILSKVPLTDFDARGMWEGPGYISAKLGAEFGNVTLFAVHTTRFPHSASQFRQINAMVKRVEEVSGRTILMGDFNATPFSRITQTVVASAGLIRQTNLPTWPATYGAPQLAIDHIFTSPDIRSLSREQIGDNAGSDHFPVMMTLAVPAN